MVEVRLFIFVFYAAHSREYFGHDFISAEFRLLLFDYLLLGLNFFNLLLFFECLIKAVLGIVRCVIVSTRLATGRKFLLEQAI